MTEEDRLMVESMKEYVRTHPKHEGRWVRPDEEREPFMTTKRHPPLMGKWGGQVPHARGGARRTT